LVSGGLIVEGDIDLSPYLWPDASQGRQPMAPAPIRLRDCGLTKGMTLAALPVPGGYKDISPNECNSAAVTGAPVFGGPAGPGGFGYQFTTAQAMQLGGTSPALSAAGFSIAIWVKIPASPASYTSIFSQAAGSGTTAWALKIWDTKRVLFSGSNTSDPNYAVDSNWHLWHLVVLQTGASTWYVDGAAVVSRTGLTIPDGNGSIAVNSAAPYKSGSSNCAIGRAYIWGRPNSADEAARLFLDEWSIFE
jgi:hypothetical protein